MRNFLKIALSALFTLAVSTAGAQHYVGVRGGWGGGSVRLKPQEETSMQWGLYSGGVSYKFFTETKYVGAIQIDLQYTGKGYVTREFPDADTSYHRTINSFELPFMWQPHFYFFQRKARFFINLGVQFSYNLNSEQWYDCSAGVFDKGPYPMKLVRDARFGYGLCGGGGISVLAGRWDITAEARYSFGFSDVLRTKVKYAPNPTESPLDNINISLGIYYRLGKGGLRSAPSKKMALRIEEAQARRILRQQQKEGLPEGAPLDSLERLEADTIFRKVDSLHRRPLTPENEPPLTTPASEPAPKDRKTSSPKGEKMAATFRKEPLFARLEKSML